MRTSLFKAFSVLIVTSFALSACDTTDPFRIPPPDFSTVPDAFDISGIEPIEIEEGVDAYILEEGEGDFEVTIRDNISVFITLRTTDGEIIFSSFNDERTSPTNIGVGNIQLNPNVFQYSVFLAYTPGLRAGILGMKEGEVRTLIVSPEKGFGGLPENATNSRFRDATLQYDLELVFISN